MAGGSARIKAAVAEAAGRQEEWPARVAAGIYAALELAAREPAAFDDVHCTVLVDYFSARLREHAPPARDRAVAEERKHLRAIVQIVDAHIRLGRAEQLLEIAPGLVQLALLPYLGFDEAKRWAKQGREPGPRPSE